MCQPQIRKRTFPHTAAALAIFDAGIPERQQNWLNITTEEAVHAAQRADEAALRAVQDAFYKDTSDINCVENCHRVDIGFLRRMAEGS